MEKITIKCQTLEDTQRLAERFAKLVKDNGCFVNLYGEIGAGKTALVRLTAEALGVIEKVTSPSFVILNEYHSASIPVYHFDLYRLEREGVSTIINELEEYSEGKILTLVEWAEFSQNSLPFDRIELRIDYIDETVREFSFSAFGQKSEELLKGLEK